MKRTEIRSANTPLEHQVPAHADPTTLRGDCVHAVKSTWFGVSLTYLTRAIGIVCGLFVTLNLWSVTTESFDAWVFAGSLIASGLCGCLSFYLCARLFERLGKTLLPNPEAIRRYSQAQPVAYLVGLITCVGAFGYPMTEHLFIVVALMFATAQVMCVVSAIRPQRTDLSVHPVSTILFPLFFISGFAALLYQIVWQRVLFSEIGSNTESVTIIISIFMLGLGIGSILGGWLTKIFPDRLPHLFVAIELFIGSFGLVSVNAIRGLAAELLHVPAPVTFAGMALLLFLPTTCMGATLPILVTYLNSTMQNVGRSVGLLYAINAFGSAVGAILTVHLLFLITGLKGVTYVAATFNLTVSAVAWLTMTRGAYLSAGRFTDAMPTTQEEG